MKRTINVNLASQAFILDEDAYTQLHDYLQRIESLYQASAGRSEIMDDIESRIAELFHVRLSGGRTVVGTADVHHVMEILGRPEDFAQDSSESASFAREHGGTAQRRFYRDGSDRILGGVCSGIGNYFGVDPLWIRLGFALSLFFFGAGVFIYLLLWVITQEARTTAERLHMRGEPINVSSIGRAIEEEVNNLKGHWEKRQPGIRNGGRKLEGLTRRFVAFILSVVQSLVSIFTRLVGIVLLVVGSMLLVTVTAFFVWTIASGDIDFYSDRGPLEFGVLLDSVFESTWWTLAGISGLALVICIPLVALIYGGFSLLVPGRKVPYLAGALFGLWFMGLILSAGAGANVAQQFSHEYEVPHLIPLNDNLSDTLTIYLGETHFTLGEFHPHNWSFSAEADSLFCNDVRMTVTQSKDTATAIEVKHHARGASRSDAQKWARSIHYRVLTDVKSLAPAGYFTVAAPYRYRAQQVELNLLLPEGKTVYLNPGLEVVLRHVPNAQDMWDSEMPGHFWKMEGGKLICVDCTP